MSIGYETLSKIYEISNKLSEIEVLLSNVEYVDNEKFNETIDLFVNLSNELRPFCNKNVEYYLERIADNIVNLIELVNNNELYNIKVKNYINDCIKVMNCLKNQVLYKNKKNIIIIGITERTQFIHEAINFNKANILAYVNLNEKNEESLRTGVVINSYEINKFDADFFVLMDEEADVSNLDRNKIIECEKYLKNVCFQSPEFSVRYGDFAKLKKDYEGIITGISYTEFAIDENSLKKKFVSLANPTQDLFYDFEMFKHGLKQSENMKNVKYCIIGLCLYSFNYDLSSSKFNRSRSTYYYPVVNSMHNFIYKEIYEEFFKDFYNKANEVFYENFHMIIFDKYKKLYEQILEEGRNKEFCSKSLSNEETKNIVDYISKEFNKDYPETRIENIRILREYLQLLKENKIKTIIVIPPLSKFYEKYVSKKMMEETLHIINELKEDYNFTFIDFSKNEFFEEKHFTDGSHMNKKGSEIFTEIINEYIS